MKPSSPSPPQLLHHHHLQPPPPPQEHLLSEIEYWIKLIEQSPPQNPIPNSLISNLQLLLHQLTDLSPFPNSIKLQIWNLSYRLWNTCVDFHTVDQVKLRDLSADFLIVGVVDDVEGVDFDSPLVKIASFFYKAGILWVDLKDFECARSCFEKAEGLISGIGMNFGEDSEEMKLLRGLSIAQSKMALDECVDSYLKKAEDLISGIEMNLGGDCDEVKVLKDLNIARSRMGYDDCVNRCFEEAEDLISGIGVNLGEDCDEGRLLLDLNIVRSRTAWESSDRSLAMILLDRLKSVVFGIDDGCRLLASQYLAFGKELLLENEVDEALKLLNKALKLSEKGLRILKRAEEIVGLRGLRLKVLRFIGVLHLHRDEFDSVLKCVEVLKESCGDKHPSLSVLSMKAWLGLGNYVEAEKELRDIVVDKGIEEVVWVSAVRSYFQAAGAAGAETGKEVFLGLLRRCLASAGATIKVVNAVIREGGGSEGMKVRAKVVAELVSDERVVDLFAGEGPAKERSSMHVLLWTCGTQYFRSKDYETSALLFEKSMLYVPHNIERRILRAKGCRSLCLCYLALLQLDRAQEYIDEAEKLEPSVSCSFLKFKICLQRNEFDLAVAQVQAMSSCLDFTPDFLSLAAHEAVSCHAIPVSIAALSSVLNIYSSGKPMATMEVVVFRTLVTILTLNPGYDSDILKCLKRAHARLSEHGPDRFFGKGEVGKREWNWFALNTWNLGIQTGKQQMHELSAEFFRLASKFYSVGVDGEAERNTMMACKSLILSVSALISEEKQKKCKMLETKAKRAIGLLDRAGKILMSSAESSRKDHFQACPNFFFIYTWSAYDLYSRFSEMAPQQLALVKSYASSKFCDPLLLLQIGLHASQGPNLNPEGRYIRAIQMRN
ncbi:hypothetical protein Leryth_000805 [Lithospermum erythrorhizon]|nr:hypothetical protein Leryth_000805 [Lithospermum erythrorhizon]